jgi:hypothetical protein
MAGLGTDRDLVGGSTAWEVSYEEPDVVLLRCLSQPDGPRWLDGRTLDGTVGLAPVTTGIYTGTRWQISCEISNAVALRCLGIRDGPRWLCGKPATNRLKLVYNDGLYDTETMWQVVRVASGGQPPPAARDGRFVVV